MKPWEASLRTQRSQLAARGLRICREGREAAQLRRMTRNASASVSFAARATSTRSCRIVML